MSRPLSSHEEIPCYGPRFRLTGKPAITLKNHAFQSQPPLRMLERGREPNAQGHVFRPAHVHTEGPMRRVFCWVAGTFTLRRLCGLPFIRSRTAGPPNSSES
jgi:hypothetical protein